jgi:hypothetical protein
MLPFDASSLLSYVAQQTSLDRSDAACVVESRRGFDVIYGWLAAVRERAGLSAQPARARFAAAASLAPLLSPPSAAARYAPSEPPPLAGPAPPPAWTRAACTAAARGGPSVARLSVTGAPPPRACDAAAVAALRPPVHAGAGADAADDAAAVAAWASRAELVARLVSGLVHDGAVAGSGGVEGGDAGGGAGGGAGGDDGGCGPAADDVMRLVVALAPCAVGAGVASARVAAAARDALRALGGGGDDDDGGARQRFAAHHIDALLALPPGPASESALLWVAPRLPAAALTAPRVGGLLCVALVGADSAAGLRAAGAWRALSLAHAAAAGAASSAALAPHAPLVRAILARAEAAPTTPAVAALAAAVRALTLAADAPPPARAAAALGRLVRRGAAVDALFDGPWDVALARTLRAAALAGAPAALAAALDPLPALIFSLGAAAGRHVGALLVALTTAVRGAASAHVLAAAVHALRAAVLAAPDAFAADARAGGADDAAAVGALADGLAVCTCAALTARAGLVVADGGGARAPPAALAILRAHVRAAAKELVEAAPLAAMAWIGEVDAEAGTRECSDELLGGESA